MSIKLNSKKIKELFNSDFNNIMNRYRKVSALVYVMYADNVC